MNGIHNKLSIFLNPHLRICFYWFLEREKYQCERETLITCLLYAPQLGMEPATEACTQTENRTRNLLTYRTMLQPTEPRCQVHRGCSIYPFSIPFYGWIIFHCVSVSENSYKEESHTCDGNVPWGLATVWEALCFQCPRATWLCHHGLCNLDGSLALPFAVLSQMGTTVVILQDRWVNELVDLKGLEKGLFSCHHRGRKRPADAEPPTDFLVSTLTFILESSNGCMATS